MEGRQNTLTAFAQERFCYNVSTNQGCKQYYSLTANNNRMRLCYNPIEPDINNNVYCEATNSYLTCDFLPPRPPPLPPPPPAGRRLGLMRRLLGRRGVVDTTDERM